MKEEKKTYYACYVDADDGTLWYSFGTSEEHLTDGLSEMDLAFVVPCSEKAYRLACEGKWDQIKVVDDKRVVATRKGSDSLNSNAPIVHALIEGRDLPC